MGIQVVGSVGAFFRVSAGAQILSLISRAYAGRGLAAMVSSAAAIMPILTLSLVFIFVFLQFLFFFLQDLL
jgi:hypothetical protein